MMKNIFIVVGVVVIIFLLWKGCQNSKSANESYKAIKDTLQSVLDDTARVQGEARRLKHENADLDLHIADLVADLQTTRGVLIDESDKAKNLALRLKEAKANMLITHRDTIEYIDGCDSLAEINLWLNSVYNTEKWKSNQLDSLYTKILQNKDSITAIWQKAYNECIRAAEFAVAELPKIKPTGQWFGTGGGFVSGPIFGATGGITHITKKQLLISGKGMLTNRGAGGMIEVGVPLNFKRK